MATTIGTSKELVKLLNSLIELDYDAIEVYQVAIEKLGDAMEKAQLRVFVKDHERHVAQLRAIVVGAHEKTAEKGDFKAVLSKGRILLGSLAGDRAILAAIMSNENAINAAYERATQRDDLPRELREALMANLADERRHLAYMEARLAAMGSQQEESSVLHPR